MTGWRVRQALASVNYEVDTTTWCEDAKSWLEEVKAGRRPKVLPFHLAGVRARAQAVCGRSPCGGVSSCCADAILHGAKSRYGWQEVQARAGHSTPTSLRSVAEQRRALINTCNVRLTAGLAWQPDLL
jgi:hypothetical protein